MIREISGDILLSSARAIVQGVAPNDHMESGLALSLRERWPSMAKDFRHYCRESHPKPGGLWTWPTSDGHLIINLLTQEPAPSEQTHPGRATIENVNHALRALRKLIEAEHIPSVALPRLATGVGGLAWEAVRPLIAEHLGELQATVYVYATYHAGQRGAESAVGGSV